MIIVLLLELERSPTGSSNDKHNRVDIIVLLCISLCLYPWTTKNDKIGHSIVFYYKYCYYCGWSRDAKIITNSRIRGRRKDQFMVRWQKGDGEATPLGPNKHLAILGEPRVPIDISGTKLWVQNPNECFWISKKILENEFWEHYVQSALMNSVGVKRKEKMTTVQVYLWILGLILVLEPFLSFSIIMAAAGYCWSFWTYGIQCGALCSVHTGKWVSR